MHPIESLWLAALVAVSGLWPGALDTPRPEPSQPPVVAEARTPAPVPEKIDANASPEIAAKSALVVDLASGSTLFAKDPDNVRPIASLTKLMTALLVVEQLKADKLITVPDNVQVSAEESRMGLVAGDQLTTEELLAGLLIVSANDSAKLLARTIDGSEEEFVKRMNRRADELGMEDTEFFNPVGFGEGKENYSTTRDLLVLSRATLAEKRITRWTPVKELTIAAHNLPVAPVPPGTPPPTEPNKYQLYSTNSLLGSYLPVSGLKTGTSDAAGQCLIEFLDTGQRQLLSIVLDSPSRFQESKSMLDWSLRAYRW